MIPDGLNPETRTGSEKVRTMIPDVRFKVYDVSRGGTESSVTDVARVPVLEGKTGLLLTSVTAPVATKAKQLDLDEQT